MLTVAHRFPLAISGWMMCGLGLLLVSCGYTPEEAPIAPWEPGYVWRTPISKTAEADPILYTSLIAAHTPMDSSNLTDWHIAYQTERQSLQAYIDEGPVRPYGARQYLYVGTLGSLSQTEWEVLEMTCIYLSLFWGVDVKYYGEMTMHGMPASARRVSDGNFQLQTHYILFDMMVPQLPKDAVNFILLTPIDVWPGNGWNYVFGQAAPE